MDNRESIEHLQQILLWWLNCLLRSSSLNSRHVNGLSFHKISVSCKWRGWAEYVFVKLQFTGPQVWRHQHLFCLKKWILLTSIAVFFQCLDLGRFNLRNITRCFSRCLRSITALSLSHSSTHCVHYVLVMTALFYVGQLKGQEFSRLAKTFTHTL